MNYSQKTAKCNFILTVLILLASFLHARNIPEPSHNLRGNGMRFTPNKGQISDMKGRLCPDILYKGDEDGADIYLRKTGISYVYSNMSEIMYNVNKQMKKLEGSSKLKGFTSTGMKADLMKKELLKLHRVDMDFIGCNTNIIATEESELEGYQNFYYAHCPTGVTHVKQYSKVTYNNLYNNIDISYYSGKGNGMKYDIIVKPHGDPSQLKLHWTGAQNIQINSNGNLLIQTSVNEFTEAMPRVYQVINGNTIDIKAEYVLNAIKDSMLTTNDYLVTFKLETFDSNYPLIIDPWTTYYGGSTTDYGTSIATDNTGNVVFTGHTLSVDFPVLTGGYSQSYAGAGTDGDAFVVKFDQNGVRQWATFYGGFYDDSGTGIATDNAGNIVITGYTAGGSFPSLTLSGGYSQSFGGNTDAFVVKFNSGGTRLWATCYGGLGDESGLGVAINNSGNIIITGNTNSSDFPVLSGFQMAFGGGSNDAFVAKFDQNGVRQWSTFYGGNDNDVGRGIATDNAGNVVITGITQSTNFPVLAGGYSQAFGGVVNAFVVKFNQGGTRLWATYYGGSGSNGDYGNSVATDNLGNIVIAGTTSSADCPVLNGFQMTFGGIEDAFVVKFDQGGTRLWATFYGGSNDEDSQNIAIDGSSNIYLCAEEENAVTNRDIADSCAYVPGDGGPEEIIIIKFTPSGNKTCITYSGTGGGDLDYGGGITIYGNLIYMTGVTTGGLLVTPGAFQSNNNSGSEDAFVASLCTNICEAKVLGLAFTANTTNVCANTPITFSPTVSNACDTTGYKFQWTFSGGNPSSSSAAKPTVTYQAAGIYTVKLVLITACKKDSVIKSAYINITGPTANAGTNITIDVGSSTQLTATGGGTYLWSPTTGLSCTTCANPIANPTTTTIYTVIVKDANNCSATDSIKITVVEPPIKCNSIFVPTAFSPNGDGENELECVFGDCIQTLYFVIYDRWGEKVFETSDSKFCWDGKYKGKEMNTAVFVYYLNAVLLSGEKITKKGNVNLIR